MESLIFYIFIFLIASLLFGINNSRNNNKKNNKFNFFTLISFLILFFISALRYNVGTDYFNYVNIFNSYSINDYGFIVNVFNGTIEPGFSAILFISKILNNYQYVFLISSLITMFFLYVFLSKKREEISVFSFLILFAFIIIPFSFSGVRQGIAITILLNANENMINKKYLKSLLYIIFAGLFHYTALIMIGILIFWILYNKSKKLTTFLGTLTFTTLVIFFEPILGYFSNISFLYHYSNYEITKTFDLSLILNSVLLRLPLLLICYWQRDKVLKKDPKYSILFIFMMLEILFFALKGVSFFAIRFAYYFSYASFYMLALIVKNTTSVKDRIILKYLILVYALTFFIWSYFVLEQADIFPYQTILSII